MESVRTEINYNFWYFFFLIIITLLVIRMCILINRKGMFVYLTKFVDLFEGVSILICVLLVYYYFVHVITSSIYIQQYKSSGLDSFFNFFEITNYMYLCRTLLCILYGLVIIRFLMAFSFGRTFVDYYYTFLLSLPWILYLTFLFIIYFLIVWRYIGYLMSNFIFPYHSTIIFHPMSFRLFKNDESFGYYATLYFLCLLSRLLMFLLVAFYVYYYRLAKSYRIIDTDSYSYFGVLKDEWRRFRNKDKAESCDCK